MTDLERFGKEWGLHPGIQTERMYYGPGALIPHDAAAQIEAKVAEWLALPRIYSYELRVPLASSDDVWCRAVVAWLDFHGFRVEGHREHERFFIVTVHRDKKRSV